MTAQLAGDIELLKSRVILSRAIATLPLAVSYYAKGAVLDYELYGYSPFRIEYVIKDSGILDTPFYLEFSDLSKSADGSMIPGFQLEYTGGKGKLQGNFQTDEWIEL